MQRNKTCFLGVLVGLLFSFPVMATHSGGIALGAGAFSAPINTETAIPIPKGRFAGGLRSEFIQFNTLSDSQLLRLQEEDPEADLHSTESLLTTSLLLATGITDNLTVGLRIPFVWRNKLREPPHGEEEGDAGHDEEGEGVENLGDANGFGDVIAFGQFRFLHLEESNTHAAVILGFKAPTGINDRTSDEGERLETELQPGSGSWDGIFGLSFTQNIDALTFNASTIYTLVADGSQDTNLGDVFNYNFAVSYRLPIGGTQEGGEYFFLDDNKFGIDMIFEINGQWREETKIGSENDRNSGGNQLYLSPGLRVNMGRHANMGFSFGIPVIDDLNGDQDNLDYRVVGSLNFYL